MSLMKVFNISGSAVSAQSQRLNVVASNLANAESVAGPDGQTYKARQVVFQSQPTPDGSAGVKVSSVVEDGAPAKRVYEPGHPMADKNGYIYEAAVDQTQEMVELLEASRQYQNNVEVIQTAKSLMLNTLKLGQ